MLFFVAKLCFWHIFMLRLNPPHFVALGTLWRAAARCELRINSFRCASDDFETFYCLTAFTLIFGSLVHLKRRASMRAFICGRRCFKSRYWWRFWSIFVFAPHLAVPSRNITNFPAGKEQLAQVAQKLELARKRLLWLEDMCYDLEFYKCLHK